jgi:hypothetical protein
MWRKSRLSRAKQRENQPEDLGERGPNKPGLGCGGARRRDPSGGVGTNPGSATDIHQSSDLNIKGWPLTLPGSPRGDRRTRLSSRHRDRHGRCRCHRHCGSFSTARPSRSSASYCTPAGTSRHGFLSCRWRNDNLWDRIGCRSRSATVFASIGRFPLEKISCVKPASTNIQLTNRDQIHRRDHTCSSVRTSS